MWMVQDGAEPELAVGDDWSVDLVFYPHEPLRPATDAAALVLVPEPSASSLAGYRLTASVRQLPATSTHGEALALEVPNVVLGYFPHPPLPASPFVTGQGTIATDRYGHGVSWAFPETKRSCVVERITTVTTPLLAMPGEQPAAYGPDWSQRIEKSIQRMHKWDDWPEDRWATYFVTVLTTR